MNNKTFREASQTMYPWSRSLEIVPGTEKCALKPMKMYREHEKRVLEMAVKACTGGHDRYKSSRELKTVSYNPRKWRQKHEQHEFSRSLSNHVSMVTIAENRPGNRKMCVAYENVQKT